MILDFEFHLIENLPPKVTVVFPSAIQYVCFQELGGKSWTSNGDVPTLIFALQEEYKGRSAVFEESKKLGVTEAIAQWKFVQGAHKDWDYVDITELTSKLSTTEIEQWRKEAMELAQDPNKLEQAFKKLDEAEIEARKFVPPPDFYEITEFPFGDLPGQQQAEPPVLQRPLLPPVVPAPVVEPEPEIEFEGPQFPFAELPKQEQIEPVQEIEYRFDLFDFVEDRLDIDFDGSPEMIQEQIKDVQQESEEVQMIPNNVVVDGHINHMHNSIALVPEVV